MTLNVVVPAIILDIDGTMADNTHRQHYLNGPKKDWDGFFSKLSGDAPKRMVMDTAELICRNTRLKPLIVTGRMEKHREETATWLMQHAPWLGPHPLFMRRDDDNTPDHEMKKDLYFSTIAPRYEVKLILEDRERVVKMWRSLGLECWQVAEGSF